MYTILLTSITPPLSQIVTNIRSDVRPHQDTCTQFENKCNRYTQTVGPIL